MEIIYRIMELITDIKDLDLKKGGNNSNLHIKDITIEGKNLSYIDFSDCVLENVTFKLCRLVSCSFFHAQMKGESVIFEECVITECNFNEAALNIVFNDAIVNNCSFNECGVNKLVAKDKTSFIKCEFNRSNSVVTGKQRYNIFMLEVGIHDCELNEFNIDRSYFEDVNFRSCKFHFSSFTDTQIKNALFSYCEFTKPLFGTTELVMCDFSHSPFENAYFENVKMEKTDIKNSYMSETTIKKSEFKICKFIEMDFLKYFTVHDSYFENVAFKDFKMENGSFAKALHPLNMVTFGKGTIKETSFFESSLDNCNFLYVKMNGVNLNKTWMYKCTFQSCTLTNSWLENITSIDYTNIQMTDFMDCKMRKFRMKWGGMSSTDFHKCNLNKSFFKAVNLVSVNILNSTLRYAIMNNCSISGCGFTGTDIAGCDFIASKIIRSYFGDAKNRDQARNLGASRGRWEGPPRSRPGRSIGDAYSVLGVKPGSSKKAIRKAYLALVKQWHPDRNKDPDATEMMKKINDAYKRLKK